MKSFIHISFFIFLFISCQTQQKNDNKISSKKNNLFVVPKPGISSLHRQDSSIKIAEFEIDEKTRFNRFMNKIINKKKNTY